MTRFTRRTLRATPDPHAPLPINDDDPRAPATQFHGVSFNRRHSAKPFKSQLSVDGRTRYLGCYRDVHSAARAYDDVARLIPQRPINLPSEGAQ